jgi:hypothetical protein
METFAEGGRKLCIFRIKTRRLHYAPSQLLDAGPIQGEHSSEDLFLRTNSDRNSLFESPEKYREIDNPCRRSMTLAADHCGIRQVDATNPGYPSCDQGASRPRSLIGNSHSSGSGQLAPPAAVMRSEQFEDSRRTISMNEHGGLDCEDGLRVWACLGRWSYQPHLLLGLSHVATAIIIQSVAKSVSTFSCAHPV